MNPTPRSKRLPTRPGFIKTGAAALVVLAAAGGVWYYTSTQESDESVALRTSDVTQAAVTSFEITTTATGELQALDQIEVRSPLEEQATIIEIIPEGTWVEKGDVLARLNTDNLETELDTEEADLESSQAALFAAENAYQIQLTENESATRDAELALRLAELTLEQWESGDRVMKLQELDLNIDEANRELARLEAKHEKNVDLLAEGFISKDQYDQDELALVKARARVETVNLQKKSYINYEQKKDREQMESDVQQAKAQLENVKAQNEIKLADKAADRASQNRRVVRDQGRVDKLRRQIEASTIRAPSDGMVIYGTTMESSRRMWSNEGPLMIGQNIYPNQLLFALPDTSKLVAEVRVHESLAGRIRPGMKGRIRVDALPNVVLSGTVKEIGVLAESGGWRDPNLREYTVKLVLDSNQYTAELKPSMRCEADILLDTVDSALSVPVTAVFNDGPVRYVYQPRGSNFVRVPVKTGRFSETQAEILAGLEAGERVLLRNPGAGEVIDQPWDEGQLQLVGLSLDEEGNPVRPNQGQGRPGQGLPAANPQAAPQGDTKRGGRPGGERPARPQGGTSDAETESETETTVAESSEADAPETTTEAVEASPEPAENSTVDTAKQSG